MCIDLALSQETLAAMVGKPRQRINRLLKQWEETEWLSVKYREVTIRQIGELESFGNDML
ncbi:helix-turn-helix domain-containing protein [Veronia nyctiphanis]|uniref:helix-turn-helix domain-containing protein n=1 Tax=Veronia nyctiphanis TaxID=1278244 RepID=UPI0038B53DDE